MTWLIKHKRSPGSSIVAEYECPLHGRFSLTIEREENGDPPDEGKCMEWVSPTAYCGEWCPHVISAPARVKVRTVTAARHGKDPDPPPGAMDWKALAYDECSPADWEAKERKKDYEMTYNLFKKAL